MSRDRLNEVRNGGRDHGLSNPASSRSGQQYSHNTQGSSGHNYSRNVSPSQANNGRNYNGRSNDSYEMTGRHSPPRGSSNANSSPSAGGGRRGGGGGGGGDFYSEVDEIQASIDAINRTVVSIERLHSRALVGVSQDESSRINRELDAAQTEASDLIADARQRLQRISNETKNLRGGGDSRSRQAQQSVLAQKLMDAAQRYQNIQVTYKQKYRQRMEREIRIARPDASPQQVEQALDSRSGPVFSQEMLSSRVGEQRRALQEVQGRHAELRKMEESIEELAQLFQDMQVLLETQQTVIDTIDTHVENAVQYVQEGDKELTQAIRHREASRKKWWIITAIVIAILLALAVVCYLQRCPFFGICELKRQTMAPLLLHERNS
ncbi:hypothetical protein BASA61_010297 [Batrachochytrium salamandrivorans]|nr:hypothetical protein BASA61_010297 [Batrachochytrium salamandrivorans]